MTISLLGKRLLVLRDAPSEVLAGGIILPDHLIEERTTGTVILTGTDADKNLEGKRVVIQKHGGQPFDYNGIDHVILYQPDIIAILH